MLVNPSDIVARAKATITECSVRNAHECVDSDTLIIDIRELSEFQQGHIPGAVHLSRGLIEFHIHKLVEESRTSVDTPQEEQAIVLYCGTGGRSSLAAKTVEELGYKNVKSIDGGIIAWTQAQLPVDKPD
ncbi:MAG: sulfurtransferase [Desulfobulbaceae bacterium]|nr:sulfurtransferase [Desulfobulbaceae bacterium]